MTWTGYAKLRLTTTLKLMSFRWTSRISWSDVVVCFRMSRLWILRNGKNQGLMGRKLFVLFVLRFVLFLFFCLFVFSFVGFGCGTFFPTLVVFVFRVCVYVFVRLSFIVHADHACRVPLLDVGKRLTIKSTCS